MLPEKNLLETIIRVAMVVLLITGTASVLQGGEVPSGMVSVPEGEYLPLYPKTKNEQPDAVPAFRMDKYPVTVAAYRDFVKSHTEWSRSRVKTIFADTSYLTDWKDDLTPGTASLRSPITGVSWFAAKSFCESRGKRLPTLAEWERTAAAFNAIDSIAALKGTLSWYARPGGSDLPEIGKGKPNALGVHDMLGLVWEWTLDFNSALVSGESRGDAAMDKNLFCGSGAFKASDPADYAAFMRFAMRSSLKGNYCLKNLGFRCAEDVP